MTWFELTDLQTALWVGRFPGIELSGGCHSYAEWDRHDVDIARLTRAWQRLVVRHEVLRLEFGRDGRQRVLADPPPYEVTVTDLRAVQLDEALRRLEEWREQWIGHALPADRWPPFDLRVTLLPGRARVHLTVDLLVADAASFDHLLLPELAALYGSPDLPRKPELAALYGSPDLPRKPEPGGFGRYADRSRSAESHKQAGAYWLRRLDTLPPAPALPTGPSAAGPPGGCRTGHLGTADWAELQRRAAAHGLTPTEVTVAAFAEILHAWSATEEAFTLAACLPDPVDAGRGAGPYTEPLLLAVDGCAGAFVERAAALRDRLAQDRQHASYTGVEVAREYVRRRYDGAGPAFPVVFTSLLGIRPEGPEAQPLGELVYACRPTPQVSLGLEVHDRNGSLEHRWQIREERFPPGMVDGMLAGYGELLARLATDAAAWEDPRLCCTPQAQLRQREEGNRTHVDWPPELLHTAVARHAAQRPDAPVVIGSTTDLTYRQLSGRVNQVGRELRRLGARPNRLVAVVVEPGWPQVVAVHGVLAAGAAYLPIDPRVPADRLRHLVEHGEVELILTDTRTDAALVWPARTRRLCVDRDFDHVDPAPLAPVQQPTDLAYVIYTSGSTGIPKGVMVDHRGALNTISDINRRFAVGAADRCLAVSGLHFDLSVYDMFGLIAAGGAVVVPDTAPVPEPSHWAALIKRAGVTVWNSVPALMEMLVLHLETAGRVAALEPLRLVVLAGDWIPLSLPDRVRRLNPRTRFVSSGGPTETCVWSVIYPVDRVDPAWPSIPYGRPMANQRYHILDTRLRPRPTWVPGEIYVASEVGLARGYWRDPARTAKHFIELPDGGGRSYATGDLGRYLPDGNIEILGRKDFQVKVQGIRVEPGEVEATINQYPGVRTSVVVAAGQAREATGLHAYVVWDGGPATGELLAYLTQRLPRHLVPQAVTVLDELPLTGNGKVDRRALTQAGRDAGSRPAAPYRRPRSLVERIVCDVWARHLGLPRVGVDDDFFRLGGDSMLAMRARTVIENALRSPIPLEALFSARTPAALARCLTPVE